MKLPPGLQLRKPRLAVAMALALLAITVYAPAWAQPSPSPLGVPGAPTGQPDTPVSVSTAWSSSQATPGSQRVLAVVLDVAQHYHINPRKDQIPESLNYLIPTTLEVVDAPAAVRIGAIQFPQAHEVHIEFAAKEQTLKAYEGKVILYVPITIEPAAKPGALNLKLKLGYQACNASTCLFPQTSEIDTILEVVPPGTATPTTNANDSLFAGFDPAGFDVPTTTAPTKEASAAIQFDLFGLSFSLDPRGAIGISLLLLVAALGGFLLNLTPCVLPVIPLKIMGLSKSAGNRARCFALGVAMSLGVIAFWLALGGAIALTVAQLNRGATSTLGITSTNQLFQYPAFTIAVGVVIAIMAVGMCGLFAVRLPKFVYRFNPRHDSYAGSFGFGIMTAILSTPCTAPFMGAAAAWAATQHSATTLATFGAIGFGMALPYLVLAAFPQLVNRMPRTGPASELLKQVMGLCMLAAAAYFIGVGISGVFADPLRPPSRVYWWPVMALLFAAGGWLAWRTIQLTPAATKRAVFAGLGVVFMLGSVYGGVTLTKKGPIEWVYYTPEHFATALDEGQTVVMDFTAEWCLNCDWLEKNVLNQESVVKALHERGVIPMKVDLTGNNEAGRAMLKHAGRLTIPLLVIYSPDGSEVFKSDFYTTQQVLDAIAGTRSNSMSAK